MSEGEKAWWKETIKNFRSEFIKPPKYYVDSVLEEDPPTAQGLRQDVEKLLTDQREKIYSLYLQDEANLNAEILSHLITARQLPREIFSELLVSEDLKSSLAQQGSDYETQLAKFIGAYTGRIFPYLYELNLSSTNSRRSRSGSTLELLFEKALDILGFPYENQSTLGSDFFATHQIGKKVDLVIPGRLAYESRRSSCGIVSVKTSLRERWQEVVEELQRSNVPHIYLATLDEGISINQVNTMRQYNITLIVREDEKKSKFRDSGTVESFQTFFDKTVPHLLEAWSEGDRNGS